MFLSEEVCEENWTSNLTDIDHYSKVLSFSWYFQENRRDRFEFYGLELILPLVTSQQSNKENYSHKWLNWVTKTKNEILSYTLTLSNMLVEFWKITILCHTRHINAHPSKMKWPRCTKVKTWVYGTYLCHLDKHCTIFIVKSIFHFSFWSQDSILLESCSISLSWDNKFTSKKY